MKRVFCSAAALMFLGLVGHRSNQQVNDLDARAAQLEPAAKPSTALPQTDPYLAAPVEIENWTKPQSGWLYVLDARPDSGDTGGRVWLVDPTAGQIMGSIRTSYHPDFALSPDGARLYITSDPRAHSTEIAVIDTAAGAVLGGQELKDRVVPHVLPSFSTMAVSRDGSILWVLMKPTDYSHLAAINTVTGEVLPGHPDVAHCDDGQFISFPNANRVDFICPTMKKVRLFNVDSDAKDLNSTYALFPWNHTLGIAEAFPSPRNAQLLTIVRGDGAVFQMDAVSLAFYSTAAHGGDWERVYPGEWPVSPSDGRLYLGYSPWAKGSAPNTAADEFRVFDTATWKKVGTIKSGVPFWSAAVSNDGKQLYALAPQQHYVMVFDTTTMRQVRTIDVGSMPALAIVAP
jgi:hypothetical protein